MLFWSPARAATAGLLIATLAACGGGSGGSTTATPGTVGTEKDVPLVPTESGTLTRHLRERLAASETGARTGIGWGWVSGASTGTAAPAPTASASPVNGGDAATGSSALLLQESGVDEGDVLVTDGQRVYALGARNGTAQALTVRTVTGGGTGLADQPAVELPASTAWSELYLPRGLKTLVATGSGSPWWTVGTTPATTTSTSPLRAASRTGVRIFDLTDADRPGGGTTLTLDGRIQASRMVGSRLWLVLQSDPALPGFDWSWQPASRKGNLDYIAALTADALLPTISRDGGAAEPLVSERDCFINPEAPGGVPSIVTVVSIDLARPDLPRQARCFAGSTETVYVTRDSLYLASVRYPYQWIGDVRSFGSTGVVTDLHKFALGIDAITYRGSARVPGRLSWGNDTARFMLSESGGDLRVVTMNENWQTVTPVAIAANGTSSTSTSTAPLPDPASQSPALLTVLRDTGQGLTRLATLPNAIRPEAIGKPGEQVYGVRYIGQRAYVVTFRRTDPLYVIDLAEPGDPRLVGQLEVPGFSERLYPLTDTLLLGVGHDAVNGVTTGVRVSLIDVSAPDRPVERAAQTIGGRGSSSAADASPHGTMIRRVGDRIRIALPVSRAGEAGTSTPWQSFTALESWRLLVDPATASWRLPAPIGAPDPATSDNGDGRYRTGDAGRDRAFDLGDTSWLSYDGKVVSAPW